jgi:eukaryotic-like serine/threonine-protein kinase
MTPDRIRLARELFDLALDRDPGDRAGFLAEACGGDDEMRHEVESLLAFHTRADHFIDRPALSLAAEELAREQTAFDVGRKLRGYRLLSKLGAGGMGEVYLAEDSTLGRKVALKILPRGFTAEAERLARFKREARAASALNHPCIITVHEIGSADGINFIATEFVEGETLRERLVRGGVTLDEIFNVGIHTAEALAVAHEAGIIHRDIKPENVMVRPDGYVKVLDFGLAKLVETRTEGGVTTTAPTLATEPGRMMGTVAYMSPEQLHAAEVDARTDIWSLGVVLFELITGSRPFVAKTSIGVISAILERDVPPVENGSYEVPDALAAIVRKALRKDREERYGSVRALLEDLKAVRGDVEFAARVRQSSGDVSMPPGLAAPASAVPSRFPRPGRTARVALAAVAVAVTAAAGYMLAPFSGRPAGAGESAGSVGAIRSIAVLPFLPLALDERNESLEFGMADTLITKLSGLRQLAVRPIGAVRRYAEADRDALTAGRALQVEAVLDGTIQQAGERIRVNLRLVRIRDGTVLWTTALDEKAADIFAVQDAISERVVAALRLELSRDEHTRLAKRGTESQEAYRHYLKGRFYLDKRNEEWLRKSIEHFSKALEADPVYAPAYAGLADAYYELAYWNYQLPREYMPKARAAAERALALDDTLADAHTSLAIVLEDFEWKFADAEREYRRAIELDPKYALARQRLGQFLTEMGRFDEARAELSAALALDPLSLNVNMACAGPAYYTRDYDGAIAQLKRTLELDPNYGEARGFLGWVYVQAGAHDDAVRTWLGDDQSEYARALRKAYDEGGIRGYFVLDIEIARRGIKPGHALPVFAAMELMYLGRKDEALEVLERAYEVRNSWLGELKTEPAWDGLRSDPRFADLLRRIGLAG